MDDAKPDARPAPRLKRRPAVEPQRPPVPRDDGGDYEVTRLTSAVGAGVAKPLPNIAPSTRFLLTWHPHLWHVQLGKIVPELAARPLAAGINGVVERRDGSLDDGRAVQVWAKRGHRPIPMDLDADAGFPSYVKRAKVRETIDGRPIYAYMTRWERVPPGSSTMITDEPGYVDWCESLVLRGIIPPAEAWVLEGLVAKLVDQRGRIGNHPLNADRIARVDADLATLRAAIVACDDGSDAAEYA